MKQGLNTSCVILLIVLTISFSFPGHPFLSLVRADDDWKCGLVNLTLVTAEPYEAASRLVKPFCSSLAFLCQASPTLQGSNLLLTVPSTCHEPIPLQSILASHGCVLVLYCMCSLSGKGGGGGGKSTTSVLQSHRLQHRQNLCCCR